MEDKRNAFDLPDEAEYHLQHLEDYITWEQIKQIRNWIHERELEKRKKEEQ